MPSTAMNLHVMAAFVSLHGLHTGDQFAASADRLDICAIAYVVTEDCPAPREFFTDEVASLRLIEASAPAMAAIRALSAALDTEPCTTPVAADPGVQVPDYIEHVSNWAATAPVFSSRPPTVDEVIGRILRAAESTDNTEQPYCTGDRCEDCTPEEECCEATCGCCPRVDEHGHCFLYPGSEEDSKYCDQHGEGWLFDRSPEAERRYQILRDA